MKHHSSVVDALFTAERIVPDYVQGPGPCAIPEFVARRKEFMARVVELTARVRRDQK